MFRHLVNAVNRNVSMAKLPSDGLRLNASKSESFLVRGVLQHTEARAGVPIDRESLHPGCPTGGNLEWHAFSVVNVWRLLDRRTRRPKVMLVPRVAAVPRSTESRPLVRNENRAEPNHNHSGGREGRPIVSSRGRKGRPIKEIRGHEYRR